MNETGKLQDFVTEFMLRLARGINSDPKILEGFEQTRGRSLLIVLSDVDDGSGPPGSGLLLDESGAIRVVDASAVSPTLTVDTTFRTFMDVMDGKKLVDQAWYYGEFNLYGSRFFADYLIIREFFEKLRMVAVRERLVAQ